MRTELVDGVKVTYVTDKISDKHDDSFWYDDVICLMEYQDRQIKILAAGEIRIHSKEGELVHDGFKERNSGFKDFELKDDHDLKKIGYDYDDDYYWENNNWFDFLYRNGQMISWDDVLGQVAHGYDEAIRMGLEWIKDEDWWNHNCRKVKSDG